MKENICQVCFLMVAKLPSCSFFGLRLSDPYYPFWWIRFFINIVGNRLFFLCCLLLLELFEIIYVYKHKCYVE